MRVRGHGFSSLQTLDEALKILYSRIKAPSQTETVPTAQTLGRKVANPLHASEDLPATRRAALDGFAVRAEDTYGAKGSNPTSLDIVGHVDAGDPVPGELDPGQALRVSSGAILPKSITAVVPIEQTEILDGTVEIYSPVALNKHIIAIGADLHNQEEILPEMSVIRPWDIAILEEMRIHSVEVFKPPFISLLTIGSELKSPRDTFHLGKTVDSNRSALSGWIELLGGDLISSMHCPDDKLEIKQHLQKIAVSSDLIISTGGTSAGATDYLAEVVAEIGEVWVHGVTIKPGRSVLLGSIQSGSKVVPIIGLPGSPLSAMVAFHLIVSDLLSTWTGHRQLIHETLTVELRDKVPSKVGTRDIVRLKKSDQGAILLSNSGSGILSSLVHADYLLEIPEDVEGYNEGSEVLVSKIP